MIKQNLFLITNKCNTNCSYCFINHGNYIVSKKDIDNIKVVDDESMNIIYGGEPTLYPDMVLYLLDKLNYKNIHIYTNGYNLEFINTLKNVNVYINYDAYKYIMNKDIYNILKYEWVFTIAPSNLDYVLDVYNEFIQYEKYPYIKIMSYLNNNYWNENSIIKLNKILYELYEKYSNIVISENKNYMPVVLRDTLKRMIGYATKQNMDTECGVKTFFFNYEYKNYINKCINCIYKKYCQFNKPCLYSSTFNLCEVSNILNNNALQVVKRLYNNSNFQRTILSIYKDTFYYE